MIIGLWGWKSGCFRERGAVSLSNFYSVGKNKLACDQQQRLRGGSAPCSGDGLTHFEMLVGSTLKLRSRHSSC